MTNKTLNDLSVITNPADDDKSSIWDTSAGQHVTITALNLRTYMTATLTGFIKADGTVAFTGNQSLGGFNLTNVGLLNGVSLTTGYILAAGTVALTGDWDIGSGRKIKADQIKARSASGLALYDFTSGKGVFVQDTTGYVGVATASPTAELTVDGTMRARQVGNTRYSLEFSVSAAAGIFYAYDGTGAVFIPLGLTGTVITLNATSLVAKLNSSGFGIGVTPTAPLHVYHATASTVLIDTVFATGTPRIDLTGADIWRTANTNDLKLGGFGGSSVMTIKTSTGFTAIGTTTAPDTMLHVHNGTAGSVTAATNTQITAESNADCVINVLTPAANDGYLMFGSPTANNRGYVRYNHTSDYLAFQTAGAARVIIESNGSTHPNIDNTQTLGQSGARWSQLWAGTTTINTSDEREKILIKPSPLGLDFIRAIKPISWVWPNDERPAKYEKRTTRKLRRQTIKRLRDSIEEVDGELIFCQIEEEQDEVVTEKRPVYDANGDLASIQEVPVYDEVTEDVLIADAVSIKHERPHYGFTSQQIKHVIDKLGVDFGGYIYDKDTDVYALRYDEFIAPAVKAIQELDVTLQAVINRLDKLEGMKN